MKARILKVIFCLSMVVCLTFALASCDGLKDIFKGGGITNSNVNNNGNQDGTAHTHNYNKTTVVKPTCTEEGYTKATCSCGDYQIKDKKAAAGHAWSNWIDLVVPTCTTDGSQKRNCENCSVFELRTLAASKHNYHVVGSKDATCSTKGYVEYKCNACDSSYKVDTTKDHSFTVETVMLAATCTTDGRRKLTCAYCNEFVYDVIKTDGHDFKIQILSDRQYKKELTAIITCGNEDCKYNEKLEKSVIGDYKKVVVEPTCVKEGSVSYEFYHEGKVRSFKIETLAKVDSHRLNGVVMDPDAVYPAEMRGIFEFDGSDNKLLCTEVKNACYFCDDCKAAQVIKSARSHIYTESTVKVTAATCDTDGQKTGYCVLCKDNDAKTVIPATGHTPKVTSFSDNNNTISVSFGCAKCSASLGTVETDDYAVSAKCVTKDYVFAALGKEIKYSVPHEVHSLGGKVYDLTTDNNGVIINAYYLAAGMVELANDRATCSKDGLAYFTCDICKDMVSVKIKKDHTYEAKDIVVNASLDCEADGKYTVFCTECKKTVSLPIGHKYDVISVTVNTEVTGAPLNYEIECSVCKLGSIGSTYNYEYENVAPTCTLAGGIYYTFTADGYTLVYTAEKKAAWHTLGGKLIDPDAVHYLTDGITMFANAPATCTTVGSGYYTCELCGENQMVSIKIDHDFGNNPIVDKKAPGCVDAGYERRLCNICNKHVDIPIAAVGHDYKYTVEVVPTAESKGLANVYCVHGCKNLDVELPKLSLEDYKIEELDADLCKEDGYIHYIYTYKEDDTKVVDIIIEEIINRANHTQGDNKIMTWTATKDGVTYEYSGYICEVCERMIIVGDPKVVSNG